MLSLLCWIVTGLVVGLIARALVPGRQSLGLITTIGLGVAGAAVGGLISSAIWPAWQNNPNINQMWPGWIMAVIGGVLVLWCYLALTRDRARV